MRKVKTVLEDHFDAGRSHRDIAMHCGVARRSVALLVERFEASGLSWPEARSPRQQFDAGEGASVAKHRALNGDAIERFVQGPSQAGGYSMIAEHLHARSGTGGRLLVSRNFGAGAKRVLRGSAAAHDADLRNALTLLGLLP